MPIMSCLSSLTIAILLYTLLCILSIQVQIQLFVPLLYTIVLYRFLEKMEHSVKGKDGVSGVMEEEIEKTYSFDGVRKITAEELTECTGEMEDGDEDEFDVKKTLRNFESKMLLFAADVTARLVQTPKPKEVLFFCGFDF